MDPRPFDDISCPSDISKPSVHIDHYVKLCCDSDMMYKIISPAERLCSGFVLDVIPKQ